MLFIHFSAEETLQLSVRLCLTQLHICRGGRPKRCVTLSVRLFLLLLDTSYTRRADDVEKIHSKHSNQREKDRRDEHVI